MHSSKIVFKISDFFFHPLRNYQRYPEIKRDRNIPFDVYGNETSLDVYYDKNNKEKMPVLVNVHGGGFVCGDKKYRKGIANFFASHGWFVVNTNYRLAPKTIFPAPTYDTVSALNKVNELAEKYNIDLDKIVVTGDSAGGYYAAHAVTAICNPILSEKLGLPEYTGRKIRALLTFCAPFDLMKCFTQKTAFNVTVDVTNCVFGTRYKDNNIDSTFKYTDEPDINKYVTKDFPETFIAAAEHDMLCGGQIDTMLETLNKNGVKNGHYIAKEKGDGHCTHLLPFKKGTAKCLESVVAFLETVRKDS